MGRRGSDDLEWQKAKKKVRELDNNSCCICKCLTYAEAIQMQDSCHGNGNFETIDPAHHYPVSIRPDLVYNTDEIYCLCRFHHDRIDNYRDPVTNEIIGKEKHEEWWDRIKATRNPSDLGIGVKELPEFFDFDD